MADRFDAAARLAEGRPAVEHTQTYVQACHALGYQHPDLTAHGSQVLDWYDTEAGLDLRMLDGDVVELRVALNTIDEALWLQRSQLTDIALAWRGSGAEAAMRFLQRHCDAAAEVAAHVRAAAEGYTTLRDNLWQQVDGKAATAVAIDDRRVGERSAWLAAAHAVTAGAGEQSAAGELVLQHIVPYVDNDIRADWLTAIRSASASMEASYDAAIDALSSVRDVSFEIPGELGPMRQRAFAEPISASMPDAPPPADVIPTVPASISAPAPAAAPPPPAPEPSQVLSTEPLDDMAPMPSDLADPLSDAAGLSTGAGNLGSLGGLAGGIGGVVGKIVDGIGGLLGSLGNGFNDPSGGEDPLGDDPIELDDAETPDDADDDSDDPDGTEPAADEEDVAAEPDESPTAASDSGDPVPTDQPPDVTPPNAPPADPPPPASPESQPEGSTPCEIAADELPQAGQ